MHLVQLVTAVTLAAASNRNLELSSTSLNSLNACSGLSSNRTVKSVNHVAFQLRYRTNNERQHTNRNYLERRIPVSFDKSDFLIRTNNRPRRPNVIMASKLNDGDEYKDDNSLIPATASSLEQYTSNEVTRRTILFNLLSVSLLTQIPSAAQSSSQIDATGQLYSPKNEMLSQGGSAAARGIKLTKKERAKGKNNLLSTGGLIQNVYETRFVAYLTRFLLVFDPAASAWWKVRWIWFSGLLG